MLRVRQHLVLAVYRRAESEAAVRAAEVLEAGAGLDPSSRASKGCLRTRSVSLFSLMLHAST